MLHILSYLFGQRSNLERGTRTCISKSENMSYELLKPSLRSTDPHLLVLITRENFELQYFIGISYELEQISSPICSFFLKIQDFCLVYSFNHIHVPRLSDQQYEIVQKITRILVTSSHAYSAISLPTTGVNQELLFFFFFSFKFKIEYFSSVLCFHVEKMTDGWVKKMKDVVQNNHIQWVF